MDTVTYNLSVDDVLLLLSMLNIIERDKHKINNTGFINHCDILHQKLIEQTIKQIGKITIMGDK